jgi:hypothetical protein
MMVWIYINTAKEVGDVDHLKVFASEEAAELWFTENDPEGVLSILSTNKEPATPPSHNSIRRRKDRPCRSFCLANPLSPLPREAEIAHGTDAHFSGDGIVRDGALELKRERNRVGNRNLPRYVVAADGAVENLTGVAVVTLRARQRPARAL